MIKRKNNPIFNQILKAKSNLLRILKPGDLAEAILIKKGNKVVYFDLGAFGTGIVYGVELSNASDILKKLKIGDKISVKIIDLENEEGYIDLSLAGAEKQKAWQILKDLQESGEIIPVKIIGFNSGGLLTKINEIKSFIPISQLADQHYPKVDDGSKEKVIAALEKLVGEELKVKIIDINSRTNKVILSERETTTENIKEMLVQYKVGDIIEGIISGVADFGVFLRFADNPKIEGLVHISELDHRLIENPKEVVKLNDSVKAKIIEIKDGRVLLSIKALKPDPWLEVNRFYKEGQEVSGLIAHFYPFGTLVNLEHSLQGFVHISEFGSVEEMKKQLEIGKFFSFKIEQIKPQEKRILLKLAK